MPYPFHLLENEKIHAPIQDVETFIRHVVSRRLFIIEKENLDETNKRFHLRFWQRDIGPDHMTDGEIGKIYWGGIEIIEWSDATEITRMWAHSPENWYIGKFGLNADKVMEERYEWLENLSDDIRQKFKAIPPKQVNIPDIAVTLKQEEGYHPITLKQIDSIVHNTLLIFKGFEIDRHQEGSNIFYTVFANVESKKVLLGVYRVWEWHDGSGRSGWMPAGNTSPEIENLRRGVWEAIMAIAVEAARNKPISAEQAIKLNPLMQKPRGGRPRNIDDDWAYEQVRRFGRDKQIVFKEWLERIGDRRTTLSDLKDSFNKAISPKRSTRK